MEHHTIKLRMVCPCVFYMDIFDAHRYDFVIAIPNFRMDFLALGAGYHCNQDAC